MEGERSLAAPRQLRPSPKRATSETQLRGARKASEIGAIGGRGRRHDPGRERAEKKVSIL